MHAVAFISVEDEDPDLVLSFALAPAAANSITLIRTPKYERLLPEEERGVSVGAGTLGSGERELLTVITIDTADRTVVIESTAKTYKLSVAAVPLEQMEEAARMLVRMNFDGSFVANAA